MRVALVHKHYEQSHLDQVIEEMKTLGAPTIKAVWVECWDMWVALEGCHRLRAADALGLTPEIEEVDYDEETTVQDLGLDYQDEFLVAEIVGDAHSSHIIEFAE